MNFYYQKVLHKKVLSSKWSESTEISLFLINKNVQQRSWSILREIFTKNCHLSNIFDTNVMSSELPFSIDWEPAVKC